LSRYFSLAVPARNHRELDGDLQAEGDRRRTRLQAGAQRRMAAVRLSWLARNGRTGVPARLARGVASLGEESRSAGIAAQSNEAQPPFVQIKPSEAAWMVLSPRRRLGEY